jgi:hypothetical protein
MIMPTIPLYILIFWIFIKASDDKNDLSLEYEKTIHDSGEKSYKGCNSVNDFLKRYSINEFVIGGKIDLKKEFSKIFYKKEGFIQHIDILDYSKEEMDTLISCSSPSPFGRGSETIFDSAVREAKELKVENFSFQFDPIREGGIRRAIKDFLGDREYDIEPYKLNIYLKGGHFKKHKDTVKSERTIASMVICLPVEHEGGILTVENEKGISISFDWGKDMEKDTIQWACFFCDNDHEISEVKEGNRVTIAYDICVTNSKEYKDIRVKEKIQKECRKNYDKEFREWIRTLDRMQVYGYYPNHAYSFSATDNKGDDLKDVLKGNDLILFNLFRECGWNVMLLVYYPDMESYGPYVSFDVDGDAEGSVDMEYAIGEEDKKELRSIDELEFLDDSMSLKQGTTEIHSYEIRYGWRGNNAISEEKYYYASTIMIFRHETNLGEKMEAESSDEEKDSGEKSGSDEEDGNEEGRAKRTKFTQ